MSAGDRDSTMSTSAATLHLIPMEHATPAQTVGNQFVSQYYTVLHSSPKHLHRFYSDSSTLTYADVIPEGGSITQNLKTATGQKMIHETVMNLGYEDTMTEIYSVDSQYSIAGAVVVQVTGALQAKDRPKRPFVQTFFLAVQEKGYYVLNDVFRYLIPSDVAADAVVAVQASKPEEVIGAKDSPAGNVDVDDETQPEEEEVKEEEKKVGECEEEERMMDENVEEPTAEEPSKFLANKGEGDEQKGAHEEDSGPPVPAAAGHVAIHNAIPPPPPPIFTMPPLTGTMPPPVLPNGALPHTLPHLPLGGPAAVPTAVQYMVPPLPMAAGGPAAAATAIPVPVIPIPLTVSVPPPPPAPPASLPPTHSPSGGGDENGDGAEKERDEMHGGSGSRARSVGSPGSGAAADPATPAGTNAPTAHAVSRDSSSTGGGSSGGRGPPHTRSSPHGYEAASGALDALDIAPTEGVFIRDIPQEVSPDELAEALSRFGTIRPGSLSLKTTRGRDGYAFVDYESADASYACISSGFEVGGRRVKLEPKRPMIIRHTHGYHHPQPPPPHALQGGMMAGPGMMYAPGGMHMNGMHGAGQSMQPQNGGNPYHRGGGGGGGGYNNNNVHRGGGPRGGGGGGRGGFPPPPQSAAAAAAAAAHFAMAYGQPMMMMAPPRPGMSPMNALNMGMPHMMTLPAPGGGRVDDMMDGYAMMGMQQQQGGGGGGGGGRSSGGGARGGGGRGGVGRGHRENDGRIPPPPPMHMPYA